MHAKLLSFSPKSLAEKLLLVAFISSIFSGWPQLHISSVSIEPIMIGWSLTTIALLFILKKPFSTTQPLSWLFLSIWLTFGGLIGIVNSSRVTTVFLQVIYTFIAIAFAYALYRHIQAKTIRTSWLLDMWVWLAIVVSIFGIIQFIVGAFFYSPVLAEAYRVGVFEFPRIHLFSLEPQYFANWLLIPFLISLTQKKNTPITVLLLSAILLTLARGSFVALFCVLPFVWYFYLKQKKYTLFFVKSCVIAIIISLTLVGMSTAANSDKSFFYGVGRFLDHATLGIFNQEGATNIKPDTIIEVVPTQTPENHTNTQQMQKQTYVTVQGTDTSGVVEASTLGRLEAIRVGVDIINDSPKNLLFGVGLYRFGEAASEKSLAYSNELISNNQFVQVFTETGLIGFTFFFGAIGYALVLSFKKQYAILRWAMIALLVQFMFFSTYTSFPFWVLFALLISHGLLLDKGIQWQNRKKSNL